MNTFTKQDGVWARCNGMNHTDAGEIVTHDRCGATVAKREDGKVYDIKPMGNYGARKYTCWNSAHHCDADMVAHVEAEKAKSVAAGNIEKGTTVEVFKGRKVAKGTKGEVFWMGEDSWGKAKLGIKTPEGDTIWIAQDNCKLI